MQRLNAHLHKAAPTPAARPYLVNLDPAVRHLPYSPNIDIRDSVNYKEVMAQYNLGPNGGIMTCLNLFATKIDQIIGLLEKRRGEGNAETVLIDTPGQIEVFVWSASGAIVTEALATTSPTVLAYVVDTPRTISSTSTFMSNMLYACSILYKTKLPMILVFNKTDVARHEVAVDWMKDFEIFQAALRKEEDEAERSGSGPLGASGGTGYMASLLNSMSLVLEEFYNHLDVVGVSSMTGEGADDFFTAVEVKRQEFIKDYIPEMERLKALRDERAADKKAEELRRAMEGLSGPSGSSSNPFKDSRLGETISDYEDDDDDDEEQQEDESSDNEAAENGKGGLEQRYSKALQDSSSASAMGDSKLINYLNANS